MEKSQAEQSNQDWFRWDNPWIRRGLAAAAPLLGLFLCQMVTVQSVPRAMDWMGEHPEAALLTYGVLLLVQMTLERLSENLLVGVLISQLPCLILSIVSYMKQVVNGVPLLISDLSMIGQASEITGFLRPGMSLGSGTWGALLILALLLAAAFFCARPIKRAPKWRRFLEGIVSVSLLMGLMALPATSAMLIVGEEGESQAMRNDRLGVLAGLYSAALESVMQEPDIYSENNVNRILLQTRAAAPRVIEPEFKPNVILVVSESFFDPTRLPNVEFSTDPAPNYHALVEEFPGGEFLSNTYAGGTGNVEMEILTGIPSVFLGAGESLTTIRDQEAYTRVPSIVKAFADQGYSTHFVHSYTDSLYSRSTHIPLLGFQTVLFQKNFTVKRALAGGYTSDDSLVDQLIVQLEGKEEGPIFLYGLTMENHQPYYAGKFNTESPVTVTSDLLEEGDELGALDALIHGLYDADAALGKLVEYLEEYEEPTILIFLGDHLPNVALNQDEAVYDRLGYSSSTDTKPWSAEELKRMVSTQFLVWNNYGAELDVPEAISCTGMGSKILGWAGLPKPLYFSWIDTVMEDVLLYRERLFINAEGTPYHEPTKDCELLMGKFRILVYDILYGEQYATEAFTGQRLRETTLEVVPEMVEPELNSLPEE